MKEKDKKRHASRQTQAVRRQLVHAAGCTEPNCCTKWFNDPEFLDEMRNEPGEETVNVPRSLRHILGPRI